MAKKFVFAGLSVFMLLAGAAFADPVPVSFPDANLLAAVQAQYLAQVGTALSDPPLSTELSNAAFTSLVANGSSISDVTGLEACTALTSLKLANNQISSLSPLAGLIALTYLELGLGNPLADGVDDMLATGSNSISDLTPLAGLTNLTYLGLLGNTGITSIAVVSSLSSLETLWLGGASIASWTPLTDRADSLQMLGVIACGISDAQMPIIAGLTNLYGLGLLAEPAVTDISSLDTLNLTLAAFARTGVSDIGVFANYSNLSIAMMDQSPVANLDALSGLSNLTNISFESCALTDISGLAGLTGISEFSLGSNSIVDISALSGCTGVTRFKLAGNDITDIQALVDNTGLGAGDTVDISGNPLTQSAVCDELPLLLAKFSNSNNVTYDQVCGTPAVLTVNVVGEGTVSPTVGTHNYAIGSTIGLNALPKSGTGYAFDHWEGDISTESSNTQILMDTDKTVTAVFVTPGDHTLTISKAGSGQGNPNPAPGVYSYLDGRQVYLSANAKSGSYFAGWSGSITSGTPQVTLTMDADKAVTATYVTSGYVLNVSTSGNGRTSLGTGSFPLAAGAVVEVSAYASSSTSFFDHWSGDYGAADPSSSTISLTMDQARSITAVFTDAPTYNLTIQVSGNGTTSPAAGTHPCVQGSTAYVQATPDPGYAFDHWEGDIAGANELDSNLSLTMSQDRTVTAVFVTAQYTLTILVVGSGHTSPVAGSYGYVSGHTARITATADAGNYFNFWSGDTDGAQINDANISFTMTQDRTVTANFHEAEFFLTIATSGTYGTTSPVPGSYGYKTGAIATIEAIGQNMWVFDHWTGDIGSADPTATTIELAMTQDRSITAVFALTTASVTVIINGPGTTDPVAGEHPALPGSDFVVLAYPNAGARFTGWSGDTVSTRPVGHVAVTGDMTITANFETFPANPIVFEDAGLEAAARQTVSIPSGNIYPADVDGVTDFQPTGRGIVHLGGLEYFTIVSRFNGYGNAIDDITEMGALTNLVHTDLADNQISDLSPLSGLPALVELNVGNNQLTDISGLADLPNLQIFTAFENGITDLSAVAGFKLLEELNLNSNPVTDLSPLSGLTHLSTLKLTQGSVSDLSPLATLYNLTTITMNGNPVTTLAPLADLTNLSSINFAQCAVTSIEGLENLPNLTKVTLMYNQITDLTPLVNNADFATGDKLYILGNPLSQDALCNQVPALLDRGVTVSYEGVCLPAEGEGEGEGGSEGEGEGEGGSEGEGEGEGGSEGEGEGEGGSEGEGEGEGGSEGEGEGGSEGEGEGTADVCHTADQDCNHLINLSELLRVIQFFNTGGYHCATGTEDGYAPGQGDQNCTSHMSDYNPQDWLINLSELLRLIQFFNTGGYHACPDAVPPTEDGLCVGQA